MNTASETHPSSTGKGETAFSVELARVGVRFELPNERILSFKEYILKRLTQKLSFRELWALRDVNLQVRPGEIFGIVGRNGAGKSTLLKVVSRVLVPTEGRVVIRGRLAPMLELGAGFHPDLTGAENVLLNATLLGISRSEIRERLGEVMEFAELATFANAPIRTYSSGMLARLGFSVATLIRPDILVLDEVLAVGDVGFQEKCQRRIWKFVEQGTTVLLVSHSVDAFERYCKRIAWLEGGRLVAMGSPADILPLYLDGLGHLPAEADPALTAAD